MPNLSLNRAKIIQFFWFNIGGLLFFVAGYGVFALLYGVLHGHWLLAKAFADLTGWSLNYLIQHYVAFDGRKHGHAHTLKRYLPFSGMNLFIDYAIVGGLTVLGVTPFLGLWISSLFFTV